MRSTRIKKLVRPWEDEPRGFPFPLKVVWTILGVAMIVGILMNQCSVPDVQAQACDRLGAPEAMICQRDKDARQSALRRREVKALEKIARELANISRTLERKQK